MSPLFAGKDNFHVFQFWKNILLHLAAFVCLVLMFWGGPGYYSPRTIIRIWNFGHIVSFALWSYLFLRELPMLSRAGFAKRSMFLLVICFVIGGSIEYLQGFVGRKSDFMDLANDMLGTLFAIAFLEKDVFPLSRTMARMYTGFRIMVGLIIIIAVTPIVTAMTDELVAMYRFPVLADFESPLEVDRWTAMTPISRTDTLSRRGISSLRIDYTTERYSGIWMKHFQRDWRGFRFLKCSMYNGDEENLEIHFRLHDNNHRMSGQKSKDRFNRSFILQKGWNDLEIDLVEVAQAPADRGMDMARIESFGFFVSKLPLPRTVYLDYVRLEK